MTQSVLFWSNDPSILLNQKYIIEIYPTSSMGFEQKINAISRLVILLSVLGSLFFMTTKFIIIGIVTLVLLFVIYHLQMKKNTSANANKNNSIKESFRGFNNHQTVESTIQNPATLENFLKSDFQPVDRKNPLGNLLLTQIMDEPDRKSAPPAFNNLVYDEINQETQKMVQKLNPSIKNTDYQLYGDLGEKFEFDQSQRNFYSMSNTKVCNDQGAFGQFLYGDMWSAKESNLEGGIARIQDAYRYTLY